MELPITQEHIDNAKRIIAERERRKHVEKKIVPEIKPVKKKKRHKTRRWWKGYNDINREMDYAIWNDKS